MCSSRALSRLESDCRLLGYVVPGSGGGGGVNLGGGLERLNEVVGEAHRCLAKVQISEILGPGGNFGRWLPVEDMLGWFTAAGTHCCRVFVLLYEFGIPSWKNEVTLKLALSEV